ncbi:hypothetical protein C3481_05590 [Microbacterium sp. Ru50]|nr:hypothetical protein C3481_05590 [Microbacterium sp. Ru50]
MFDDPSDSVSRGAGSVIAAVKDDGTIIEDATKPAWWDRVDESVKTRLLESDGQDIDVVAIAKAGGVSVATAWGSEPATGWRLSSKDEDWIAFEIVRSAVQI